MDDRPIGMFDSGFGGLTVARALIDLLPDEDLIYLGDSGRYPYGSRPLEQVQAYAVEISRYLLDQHDVKMIVVACNNASAAALGTLRFELDVPVVGVIDPGVRAAIKVTRNHRVGVIATQGTVASGAYQRWVRDQRAAVDLSCVACPGFVELVERDQMDTDEARQLAARLLLPLKTAGVD